MFARFDENPAMTLRVIKETKRYGRTHGRTDNVKTVYPLQTKFAGGIIKHILWTFYNHFQYKNKTKVKLYFEPHIVQCSPFITQLIITCTSVLIVKWLPIF